MRFANLGNNTSMLTDSTLKPTRPLGLKGAAMLLSLYGGVRMFFGMITSVLVAMAFGAGIESDAYNIGIYLPMVLMCFCGLDLMRAILVSVFSKLDVDKREEPSEVFSSIVTVLGIISVFVTVFGLIFAPFLVKIVAPEVTQTTTRIAINITRIVIPGVMLMMLGAMTSAVLLAYHEYTKSQVFDVLSKAILAVAAVVCLFINNIYILSVGFIGGQLISVAVSLKLMSSIGLKFRLRVKFSPVVKEIIWQSLPVWIGVMATYGAVTIQRRYASMFLVGSIASLRYAETVFNSVATLVSVPLARALSPRIARKVALQEHDEEARLFWACFKKATCIALVVTALITMCSRDIISVVFQRGTFDSRAVDITSSLFVWIGVGVWGNTTTYLTSVLVFAHKRSYLSMVLNIISSAVLCLVVVFTIDIYGIKAIGIAFGISQALRGFVALAIAIHLLGYRLNNIGVWLIRFLFTSVVSIVALKGYILLFGFNGVGFWENLLDLTGAAATIIGIFVVAGYLIKLDEAVSFVNLVKSTIVTNLRKRLLKKEH